MTRTGSSFAHPARHARRVLTLETPFVVPASAERRVASSCRPCVVVRARRRCCARRAVAPRARETFRVGWGCDARGWVLWWYAASVSHRPAFGRRRRRRPSRARCAHRSKRRGAHGALQFVVPLTSHASDMFHLRAASCAGAPLVHAATGRCVGAVEGVVPPLPPLSPEEEAAVTAGGEGEQSVPRPAGRPPHATVTLYAASRRRRRSRSFGSLRATVPHRSCAAGCGGPIVSDRRLDVRHMIDHMAWHDVPFQAGPAGRSSATCAAASRARPSTPRRRTSGRCSRSSTPASEVGTATAAVCRRCVGRRVEERDRAREGVDVAKPGSCTRCRRARRCAGPICPNSAGAGWSCLVGRAMSRRGDGVCVFKYKKAKHTQSGNSRFCLAELEK